MSNNFSVYHVFNAVQVHLVPGFISQFREIGLAKNIPTHFILCNYSAKYAEAYEPLINEIGMERFEFIEDKWITVAGKFSKLLKVRENKFVIHGIVLKLWFLLPTVLSFHTGRFSWVCWGSGLEQGHKLQMVMKKRLYAAFSGVNCLMLGDKNDLERRFNIKKNVRLIPYVSNYNTEEVDRITPYFDRDKLNILVGHRASPFLNHIYLFEQLAKYVNNNLRIVCFLNYGSDDQAYIKKLIETGKRLFNNSFVPITSMLTKNEYEGVMRSIDVTIIAGKKQAGLGAIYRTILYEGTVFLEGGGKNSDWLNYLDIKTSRIEDIQHFDFNRFTAAVTNEEKQRNREAFLRFVDKNRLLEEWNDFLVNNPA